MTEVTGAKPTVGAKGALGRLVVVVVAEHDVVATGDDFAHAVVVDIADFDFDSGDGRLAARVSQGQKRCTFGQAVGLLGLNAERGESVGGFLRTNHLKGSTDNLNSKGMVFQKFCISEIRENADHQSKEAVYSIISRLSTLASGYELKEILNN